MHQLELAIPPDADLANAEHVIEAACAAAGLRLTLNDTLKKYPGCLHWHYKQARQPGTLEITLWQTRIWFNVQSGRTGDWIDKAIARLQPAIAQGLISREKGL
jgi:hypothetical protein